MGPKQEINPLQLAAAGLLGTYLVNPPPSPSMLFLPAAKPAGQ